MEINELRNCVFLKDPFTAYGSLYGNLNAMTSAKNNCFRSCTSEKKNELWSRFGDEQYATVRISSVGFKADILIGQEHPTSEVPLKGTMNVCNDFAKHACSQN